MAVVVVGINHRHGPLALLERLTVPPDELSKLLIELGNRAHIDEAIVLSTCMRTEVYVASERFHGAVADVRDALAMTRCLALEDFNDYLYTYYDESAAKHLFRVASGLDSAVLGEGEVLGQVVTAWERGRDEGATGPLLSQLFRHAIEAGKRVRTKTDIARGTTSISQAAIAMATQQLGTIGGKRVVMLGAGEMGAGMAYALRRAAKVADVVIANRTIETAEAVAARVAGRAVGLSQVREELRGADVLLASTGANTALLDVHALESIMAERPDQPLLIVDVAVPRDVDPAVAELPGVTLLDIEDLKDFAETGSARRSAAVDEVERIVSQEVDRYLALANVRQVAPLVTALRSQAEAVRVSELQRASRRLSELDAQQREEIDALTRAIVAKLVHGPTVNLKQWATEPGGERIAEAFRQLYGLDT